MQLGEWKGDPTGRHPWRWWDGHGWGDAVSDGRTTSYDRFPHILSGRDVLDVVGESHYQPALHQIEAQCRDAGRGVIAIIEPDPKNPYDPNAVKVTVSGHHVGHLPAGLAKVVQPVLGALEAEVGSPIGVAGNLIGGGPAPDGGTKRLGVLLHCDITVLGLAQPRRAVPGPPDTGLRTAMASGGFAWLEQVPSGQVEAIRTLRRLLTDLDRPIERHYVHIELVKRLYKVRDDFASALEDCDRACEAHHAEIDDIRPALLTYVEGKIPRIVTYKQAAIRHAKAHDLPLAFEWAERGIEVYGADAHRPEDPADLEKRSDSYRAKLKRART